MSNILKIIISRVFYGSLLTSIIFLAFNILIAKNTNVYDLILTFLLSFITTTFVILLANLYNSKDVINTGKTIIIFVSGFLIQALIFQIIFFMSYGITTTEFALLSASLFRGVVILFSNTVVTMAVTKG